MEHSLEAVMNPIPHTPELNANILLNANYEFNRCSSTSSIALSPTDISASCLYTFCYSPSKRKIGKEKRLFYYTPNSTVLYLDNKFKVVEYVTNRYVVVQQIRFTVGNVYRILEMLNGISIKNICDHFLFCCNAIIPANVITHDPIVCEVLSFAISNYIRCCDLPKHILNTTDMKTLVHFVSKCQVHGNKRKTRACHIRYHHTTNSPPKDVIKVKEEVEDGYCLQEKEEEDDRQHGAEPYTFHDLLHPSPDIVIKTKEEEGCGGPNVKEEVGCGGPDRQHGATPYTFHDQSVVIRDNNYNSARPPAIFINIPAEAICNKSCYFKKNAKRKKKRTYTANAGNQPCCQDFLKSDVFFLHLAKLSQYFSVTKTRSLLGTVGCTCFSWRM